jgi:acyl-CoA synthetase (AMP-forming)/AMP-acid ligase II
VAEKLIHQFLEDSASRFPDKVAIIHEEKRIAYRQVNDAAHCLSAFLKNRMVRSGDRVVLMMENSCEYVIAYYGILKSGAVVVPLSTDLKPEGLNALLAELEPTVIISSPRFERLLQASDLSLSSLSTVIIQNPKLDWSKTFKDVFPFQKIIGPIGGDGNKIPVQDQGGADSQPACIPTYAEALEGCLNADIEAEAVSDSDLANIIYTSGSTGKPKGVMLTHANIVANVNSICDYLQLTADDIQMVVLPFFYVMGKSLLNTIVAVGGTLVINNKFAFPASVINQMIEEKVTLFSGVPSTFAYLLHRSPLKSSADQLTQLRMVTQAGGHMARSVKKALREALPDHTRICIMYGATEASARLAWLNPDFFEQKIDSIGQAIPGVTIRVLDAKGVECPPREKGEIVASGTNIMRGYWRDPEATTAVLDQNGYHTGDIGWQDENGFIFLDGRKDNLLKVGGHRINPQEVEDALLATQMAVEASVVGIPDALLGTRMCALVVPLNGGKGDAEMIMASCATLLPRYKLPSDIKLVRSLPKNANGKVDRKACLKLVGGGL